MRPHPLSNKQMDADCSTPGHRYLYSPEQAIEQSLSLIERVLLDACGI